MSDMRVWLAALRLDQYADAFDQNRIDFEVLGALDHDTLKELGVAAVGDRLKILKAAATAEAPTAPTPAPAAEVISAKEPSPWLR